MAFQPVKSTFAKGFEYDEATQTLTCHYHKGPPYSYQGVTPEVAAKVRAAESFGKAMREHVLGKFSHTKHSR